LVGFGSSAFAQEVTVNNPKYVSSLFTPTTVGIPAYTSSNGTVTFDSANVTDTKIGDLKIAANGDLGFTVEAKGPAKLARDGMVNSEQYDFSYQIQYVNIASNGGSSTGYKTLDPNTAVKLGDEPFTEACAVAAGCSQEIQVKILGSDLSGIPSGSYKGTLTFTVTNDAL
jgi:hypothetical protein